MLICDCSSDVCSSDLGISAMEFAQGNALLIKQDFAIFPFYGEAIGAAEFPEATAGDKELFPFFPKLGRASCRERVCQDVYISVAAVSLKQYKTTDLEALDNSSND